jgi:hypothetical protein
MNKGHKISKELKGNKLRFSLEISRLCSGFKDAFRIGKDAFGKKG